MATKNGINYSSPKNIDLQGVSSVKGSAIRFNRTSSSNPFDSSSDGLYVNTSNQLVFSHQGSVTTLGGSGAAVSLDTAYGNGASITMDNGALTLNDSTSSTANAFTINKSGAGSGDVFEITMSAAHTGRAINLDMNTAIAAVAIHIDNSTDARTATDLLVTDDSSGNHNVIEINHSGTGEGVGFAWTDSRSGSPTAFGAKFTLDNADGLDSTAIQIVRGTGVRTVPAIDINDASTGSAHIIDVALTGVYTGDVFNFQSDAAATGNVFFLDLDDAVAMTALHIEGSGTRTAPYIELASDSTGSAVYLDFNIDGAGSGNFMDFALGTTYTGNVIAIDMNLGVGAAAIFIDGGNKIRTANLFDVTHDGSGNVDFMQVVHSNTGTEHVFDINVTGAGSGNVLDIVYSAASTGDAVNLDMTSALAGSALTVVGAGDRTVALIKIDDSSTGDSPVFDINCTGVYESNVFDVNMSAAATGDVISIDLNASVAGSAIVLDAGGGARSDAIMKVTADGTGASAGATFLDLNVSSTGATGSGVFDIDVSSVHTGAIFDIGMGAAATGDVISIDLNLAVASRGLYIDAGGGTKTVNLIELKDDGNGNIDSFAVVAANTGSGSVFDIDVTGARTGNIIDIAISGVATANVIAIDMNAGVAATAINIDAGAATRTQPLIEVKFDGNGDTIGGTFLDLDVTNTGATASALFDIDVTAVYTGDIIDIEFGNAAASTGSALKITTGTNLAGNAIEIVTAGIRTSPVFLITGAGTDATANDHIFDINQTGLLDSNVFDVTYSSGVSTGNAIDLNMGSNVAGMAISISSAATGVSGEGACLNVAHTGDLTAGADAVYLESTGNISATSTVLSVVQKTGAGTSGAYAVYISAEGDNVEALKVDTGKVVFDETLLVTGIATFTAKPVLPILTELNTAIDTRSTSAAINSTATATASEVATGYITSTSAGGTTITLPTGTALGGELGASAGDVFDLVIDNTAGSSVVTIAVAVNGILSTAAADTPGSFGDLTVASGATGLAVYRIMFSSATAYAFTRVA